MTKSKFKKEIAGMFNNVRSVEGVNIARVCWKEKSWMIIENQETFDDAAKKEFAPIESYPNTDELYDALYKSSVIKMI